jgi:hypothetical protein
MMRFQVLKATRIKTAVFGGVASRGFIAIYRRFIVMMIHAVSTSETSVSFYPLHSGCTILPQGNSPLASWTGETFRFSTGKIFAPFGNQTPIVKSADIPLIEL